MENDPDCPFITISLVLKTRLTLLDFSGTLTGHILPAVMPSG